MTIPQNQQEYTIATGSSGAANVGIPIFSGRNPSAQDIRYPLGQRWINQNTNTEWALTSFNTHNGITVAIWSALGGASIATTYVETAGTAVPVGGILNVLGGTGINTIGAGNTITISAIGYEGDWVNVTSASQTISQGNNYASNFAGLVTFQLPATCSFGDYFRIGGVQGSWRIHQAAGQEILIGEDHTTVGVGGSVASTNAGDCIECFATNTSANSVWRCISLVGNLTIV